MKSNLIKFVGILGALLLILAVLGPASVAEAKQPEVAAQQGIDGSGGYNINIAPSRPWTAEEMRAAKPYPMPKHMTDEIPTVDAFAGPDGPAGAVAGTLPEFLGGRTGVVTERDLQNDGPEAMGYAYPGPFTRQFIHTISIPTSKYPFIAVGKVFFKQYGSSYVCSAAAVGPSTSRGIITAGHCLHAGDNSANGWSTNVVFVPGYHNGTAPFGQWSAYSLRVMSTWYSSGNFRQDVAAAKLSLLNSKTITQAVGSFGFAWNQSRNSHWWLIGYPAGSPFTGAYMTACQASYAYDGTAGTAGYPAPVGVGCDMTGGCSGGPWIKGIGTTNYINGVNSYRRSTYAQELYSPYFDSTVKTVIYDWAILP